MKTPDPDAPCPCESGFTYAKCCGVEGRNATNVEMVACLYPDAIYGEEKLTPELQAAIESIAKDPGLFPARFNFMHDKIYFVKMSPRWYRESVFLDPGRMRGTCVFESNREWTMAVADQIERQTTSFIFHTAFCGSTLMTQALDSIYHCLSLREPDALGNVMYYTQSQDIAGQEKNTLYDLVFKLLSRRYTPEQGVVVKANDYANAMMLELLQWHHDTPMVFMYTPLSEFIAGCLKADNRRDWIRQRYKAILPLVPYKLDTSEELDVADDAFGKMAAVYWSYNMALFHEARRHGPGLIKSLDFNDMLSTPLSSVEACGELFKLTRQPGIDAEEQIENLLGVYSKNNKFSYSPRRRANDIETILIENRRELEAGEKLAQQLLADDYPAQGLPGALLS